jgi:peptidoglycan hydrolase CwlO-like protein
MAPTNDSISQLLSYAERTENKVDSLGTKINEMVTKHAIIEERVMHVKKDLSDFEKRIRVLETTHVVNKDHEPRMRAVESFHSKIIGVVAVVTILIGIVTTLIMKAISS